MAQITNHRVTADVEGDFVVFVIGMRVNRPWKVHRWLPVFMAMPKMIAELEKKPESGFLGAQQCINLRSPMLVQYWRSFEQLEAYARDRDARHFPAWVKFNKTVSSNGDVGIWHETYRIAAGQYECIYNNMPPTGLGKVTKLVPAAGYLETARGRMRAQEQGEPALTDA